MIPVSLRLQNFLSYGEQCEPIQFDGIHVACLSGPNGHGKSALLDAITWSLWGQARTNTADDLVRLGQSSMLVEFEFLLGRQRYRVVRKRNKARNSQSDLQFQVRHEEGDWRALTGQGVRGTQERITETLRMDYDTFINSSFILQGRADEFTRRTPGERKRILGEILNLSVYDQLCDAARVRSREAGTQVQQLEAAVATLEREQDRLPALRAEVERLERSHTETQLAVEKLRAELTAILVEKERLDARRREREELARRLQGAEAEVTTLRSQLAAAARRVEEGQAVVRRAVEIRQAAQELDAVSREREAMTERLGELRTLEQEASLLQRRMQTTQHGLETKLELTRQRVRELRAKADQLSKIAADVRDLESQTTALDRLHEERAAYQARLQELAGEAAAAKVEERCRAEDLVKADERFHILKAASARCPVCESELPEPKRKELGWKLKEEKTALKEAQGRAIQRAADAKREDAAVRQKLQELESKLKTLLGMRDRLAQARQTHLQLEEAARELPEELKRAADLEAMLQAQEFAPEERAQLAAVEARMKALRYDRKRHEAVSRRAGELAGAERQLHALERAESSLPEDRKQVEHLEAAIRLREEAMAEDRAARAAADRDLTRAPAVEAEAARVRARMEQAEREEARAAQQLGGAREALQRSTDLAAQIGARRAERDAAAADQAAYEELSKAFGRNGIQALIIENALPEIEAEANVLLGRMTGGQLAVRLKTQRELRAGGQAETLEIEISDGLGPRRYELYSGGEAFRVNFAIRIALSKLLARRAGARLETLVIDEGFGSQDQQGREGLLEAIQSTQDDFAKVLIITHIDELKEAFPNRIEVTKGPMGSQVTIY